MAAACKARASSTKPNLVDTAEVLHVRERTRSSARDFPHKKTSLKIQRGGGVGFTPKQQIPSHILLAPEWHAAKEGMRMNRKGEWDMESNHHAALPRTN